MFQVLGTLVPNKKPHMRNGYIMHFELFRIKYIHQHIKSCLKQVKITHSITQVKQFANFPLLRL